MNDTFDYFAFTQTEKSFLQTNGQKNLKEEILFDDTCCFTESFNEKDNVDVLSEDLFSEQVALVTNKSYKDEVKTLANSDKYKISQSIVNCLEDDLFLNTFQQEVLEDGQNSETTSDVASESIKSSLNISTEDIFSDVDTNTNGSNNEEIIDTSLNSENDINFTNTANLESEDFFSDINTQIINTLENEKNYIKTENLNAIESDNEVNSENIKTLSISEAASIKIEYKEASDQCQNGKVVTNSKASFQEELSDNNIAINNVIKLHNSPKKCDVLQPENVLSANEDHNKQEQLESKETLININQKILTETSFKNHTNSIMTINNLNSNLKQLELSEESLQLSSWSLPESVLQKYKTRKVIKMFHWQVECLSNKRVLDGANLVYSAPTSAGKTLVAEILAIKTVFERKKKVIFILPFVSIVREKMYYFQDILGSSGIRVEGFMGSYNPPGGFQTVQVAICTMEKANSLINKLLEEGKLSDIGAILVDEIHLLGDPSRGYLLELLLTKLKYITMQNEDVNIQIVGMSATLPNLNYLAKWLDAELYTTNFRPIPLLELAHVCGEIYDNKLELTRKLEPIPDIGTDTDNILQLCLETIEESCSVLIFCPTKNWCENLSQQISSAFYKIGSSKTKLGEMLRSQLKTNLIMELLEQLKYCPAGLDEVLKKTVSFGVAFHHAGLTMDERDIIEGAFRNGGLRVLVATSTLSSGVNLPARRVIIRTPIFHGKPIDSLIYRQMIGRAGRMGKDDRGESILICQRNDYRVAKELMSAELQPVESCLEGAGKLKRAILEVIASGVANSPADVALFTNCTLLAVETHDTDENLENPIDEAVNFLRDNEFIRLQKGEDGTSKYVPTSLGRACLSSSMAPDEGLALFTELEKARQCFVLETELHLIYLVTPYSACNAWGNIDWMFYLDLWEKLPTSMKKVGELVGVRDSYLISATRGKIQTNTNKLYHKLLVHKRFFVALALQDLVNEKGLGVVCSKYNCNRGMLQSLQQSASSFAGMVTSFSRQLGWSSVEILVSQFQDRLQFGVSRDLLDLMRLPALNGKMARVLYNAGVETVVQLANSDILNIENILYRVMPFESQRGREGESEFAIKQRNKIRNIWVTGKEGLTMNEAAEMLIKDARTYLKMEMGLVEAKWDKSSQDKVLLNANESYITTNESSALTNIEKNEVVIQKTNCKNTGSKCISNGIKIGDGDRLNPDEPADCANVAKCSKSNMETYVNSINVINTETEVVDINTNSKSTIDDCISDTESMFSDSFTLQLSDESLNSPVTDIEEAYVSSNTNQNVSINEMNLNTSDDVLVSSFNEETEEPTRSVKRKRQPNIDQQSKLQLDKRLIKKKKHTIPKRQTVQKEKNNLSDSNNEDYIQNKLENESELNFNKFNIVDICASEQLLHTFCDEVKQFDCISLAVGCSLIEEEKHVVGLKSMDPIKSTVFENEFSFKNRRVNGVAVSMGEQIVYYISFNNNLKEKALLAVRTILSTKYIKLKIFDSKEQIKCLKKCCDLDILGSIEDPKVADWILEPEGKEKNLLSLCVNYCPELVSMVQMSGSCRGVGSVSLDISTAIDSRLRSSIEALATWYVTDAVKTKLTDVNSAFLDIYDLEMKTCLCLSRIEINGMGVSKTKMENLADNLRSNMETIEAKCYSIAGRRFAIASPAEVARVLGMSAGKKVSTKKEILEKSSHPVAGLILQWRKLSCTMSKMIYPLIRSFESDRLKGCYVTHTATGRITMHEPNLQNVAKDFTVTDPLTKSTKTLSCRNAFVAAENCTLVSADYCQLELRLLAHLSQDKILCKIMKEPGDVFRSIAAKWNNVKENEVDNNMRQRAKHICYGIIYGMGYKTLADQLNLADEEAMQFMETFKNAYPGIQIYIQKTIENCKTMGYVQTVLGRRRYLPHINSSDSLLRSQAERQAINTTVQGSAADMAKKAMVLIDDKLMEIFYKSSQKPKLILHLHDELIYEVPTKYIRKVAKIMKKCMENAEKLSIPFPVKLRAGHSWGELIDYHL